MVDTRPGPGPERAGAPEDTHPPGRRERAIAQPPARPGGSLGRSWDDGPEGRGQALPPANELVDPEVHLLGHRRHAQAGRVEAGDVGGAAYGDRAGADDPEVITGLAALADRGGGANDGVFAGVGRAAQLRP